VYRVVGADENGRSLREALFQHQGELTLNTCIGSLEDDPAVRNVAVHIGGQHRGLACRQRPFGLAAAKDSARF
jgi:hypothetical protein